LYCGASGFWGHEKRQPKLPFFDPDDPFGRLASDLGLGTNFAEFLAEFFNAASGIDDFVLAGVERVRFRRNFDLDQRIFFAFKGGGFAGVHGRTGDEFEVAGQIVEHHVAVIWMNIGFHECLKVLVANLHFGGRPAS
jgi:hypothetical protein